jgi:general stress protein YciG
MPEKQHRGFHAMDPEKHRGIASRGGKRAHELGVGHEFTHDEAVVARKKGGEARRRKDDEKDLWL